MWNAFVSNVQDASMLYQAILHFRGYTSYIPATVFAHSLEKLASLDLPPAVSQFRDNPWNLVTVIKDLLIGGDGQDVNGLA